MLFYNLKLLILRLCYYSKIWLQHCILAAQDCLVGAYLHGAGNGIESWYS